MKLDDLKLETDYFHLDEPFVHKVSASPLKNPKLVSFNPKAASLIDLDSDQGATKEFLIFMNGELVLEGSTPFASVYAGHQFGYFVPQLGDGRAINLGQTNTWHLQTKGSGVTRYSRGGDGRAVLRSSIREYLMSEAMAALGIPTTRALAVIDSDSFAHREWQQESCSIVLRMSPSWVRVGSFEFLSRTKNGDEHVKKLADYVITSSYPHLENETNKYEKMFYSLVDKTALLVAKWQAYGFMHGVLNTDNFSMAGITIDYGPFAFMDYFEQGCICNHTDEQGRYSFSNQPYVARWNLLVLVNALQELCDERKALFYLESFIPQYEKLYFDLMNERLGLHPSKSPTGNRELIVDLLHTMEEAKVDYNHFFYHLSTLQSWDELKDIINTALYPHPLQRWFERYAKACDDQGETFQSRHTIMKKVNPKYTLKNYILQEAIEKADKGDYHLVDDLLHIAQNPFDEHPNFERYAKPTPLEHSNVKLSCSS